MAGIDFTVWRSTDLQAWTELATVPGVDGVTSYTDPCPAGGRGVLPGVVCGGRRGVVDWGRRAERVRDVLMECPEPNMPSCGEWEGDARLGREAWWVEMNRAMGASPLR